MVRRSEMEEEWRFVVLKRFVSYSERILYCIEGLDSPVGFTHVFKVWKFKETVLCYASGSS